MIKNLKNFALAALMAFPAGAWAAAGLTLMHCSLDSRPAYRPLWSIDFAYRELLSLNDSTANVYNEGGEMVAEGRLVVDNYHGDDSPNASTTQQGTVKVAFDEALVLPKGETFTVVIPQGSFAKEGDPDVKNEQISYSFTIPTDLGDAWAELGERLEDGTTLANADHITFFWETETESDGEQRAILYREGVQVRQFPFQATWDWDLGQAHIDFGGDMKFEKGVGFAIEIPEGTVHAMQRSDIKNKKAALRFVGGCEEPLPPIDHVWCSLSDSHLKNALGEVQFHYDRAVMLSPDPKVQLWLTDETAMVKEATPTLTEEGGKWILKADFEETPLTSGKGYTVVMPGGTLISADGDVVINQRKAVAVNGTDGIASNAVERAEAKPAAGGISITGLPANTPVAVYRLDGVAISKTIAAGDDLFVPADKGGYMVRMGSGLTKKVVVAQ